MDKIKKFFVKYKKYILIGGVIGLILGVLCWLYIANEKKSVPTTTESISSPFVTLGYGTAVNNVPNNIDLSESQEVYKTTKPEDQIIKDFVKQFYKGNPIANGENGTILWSFNTTNISYVEDSSLLFITSTNGLSINTILASSQIAQDFLTTSFSVNNIKITEEQNLGNGQKQYNGYITTGDTSLGSLYLEGYGVQITVKGNILYSLSLLYLPSANIIKYQSMPSSQLRDLLSNAEYPMYVSYLSEDENYQKQNPIIQASTKLKTFSLKTYKNIYLFDNFTYGYIFPAYKLNGDGSLIDSQNKTYWADTNVYICSLNPQYLKTASTFQDKLDILDPAE